MKLLRLKADHADALLAHHGLAGRLVVLLGGLWCAPELAELPAGWPAPAAVICAGCDPFLERLLNARGVAVTAARDPVDGIPDGAEVSLDLTGGALTETASGRRFALVPLRPTHVAEMTGRGSQATG